MEEKISFEILLLLIVFFFIKNETKITEGVDFPFLSDIFFHVLLESSQLR